MKLLLDEVICVFPENNTAVERVKLSDWAAVLVDDGWEARLARGTALATFPILAEADDAPTWAVIIARPFEGIGLPEVKVALAVPFVETDEEAWMIPPVVLKNTTLPGCAGLPY
jgi:hypothetical protein